MDCDVVVAGAGPGGCATAYHLHQAGWRVIVAERLTYPVDKMCGEFLSPEGVVSLERMGLRSALASYTPPSIDKLLLSSHQGKTWTASLPRPGLGLTRRRLDQALAQRCREVGIEVVHGLQIRDIDGNFEHGFHLRGRGPQGEQEFKTRLVVGAFGKQSLLHRKLRGATHQAPASLMALKLYAEGGHLPGHIELHVFPGGYAGICEVEDGRTILCLLTETAAFRRTGANGDRFGAEVMAQNPLLGERLSALRPAWSSAFAIANLAFGPRALTASDVLMVGDAAASISPLCGDGMSMALRAAELLAPLADRFLAGDWPSREMVQTYQQHWRQEFSRRLWVGRGLQKIFLTPSWGPVAMVLLHLFPKLGQRLIDWTRGE
ncbi:MAG: NAD(P)/FAD-dependent oxidoreductase [Candidatus Tectomicrobia bacterium]|nr:NAD(P)/FAD-dependent oxidoreductase [Candidatus Tectomicrobia bacterium]